MTVEGRRIRIPKWIFGDQCVVKVDIEAVVPDFDPGEPCLEPDTVRWLDQLQRQADAGDVEHLSRIGEVYVRRSA
jgi:hypothetical protein